MSTPSRSPIDLPLRDLPDLLEDVFLLLHKSEFIHPDPLEKVLVYKGMEDREITGLIAACLSYGRVNQILSSIDRALQPLGPSPKQFLVAATPAELTLIYKNFRHRFTSGEDLSALLIAIRHVIQSHGSLGRAFENAVKNEDETLHPALAKFVALLRSSMGAKGVHLLPDPSMGSPCKRLHLFLRWMIRHDNIDPGGWNPLLQNRLIVPLDTHLFRFARQMGLTARKQADLRAALEITAAFRAMAPHDPSRFDFSLTRLGIHPEARRLQALIDSLSRPSADQSD